MFLHYILVFGSIHLALSLNNGLALKPPMGWMSWERFRCNIDCDNDPENCISEKLYITMAELMVNNSYFAAGYEYVSIDDCWMTKERDKTGRLVADPDRFKMGIKNLTNIIHGMGLKMGIYEDIGYFTCGLYPGSEGFEKIDAQTFADWEIDYLKLDGCFKDPAQFPIAFPLYSLALNRTGRPIVFSCEWPTYLPHNDTFRRNYSEIRKYCNSWRNYDDVEDSWQSILNIVDYMASMQDYLIPTGGPGGWHDPDMNEFYAPFQIASNKFKIFFTPFGDLPLWYNRGIPIGPGDLTHLKLHYSQHTHLSRPYGVCAASKQLPPFGKNTLQNCLSDCYTRFLQKSCECSPFIYYGFIRNVSYNCDMKDIFLCDAGYKYYTPNETIDEFIKINPRNCTYCEIPCKEEIYDATLQYTDPLDNENMEYIMERQNVTVKYFRSNYLILNIYYDNFMYQKSMQRPVYTISSLLSDIGGTLGLCLGMSILTLAEIVDYIARRISQFCERKDIKPNVSNQLATVEDNTELL